jgi:hypothetical protein
MSKYFGGGNGSSIDNAVIIKNLKDPMAIIDAQIYWISQKYPDFLTIKIHKLQKKGKKIECFEYFRYDNDDKRDTTYFDVTGLYG